MNVVRCFLFDNPATVDQGAMGVLAMFYTSCQCALEIWMILKDFLEKN